MRRNWWQTLFSYRLRLAHASLVLGVLLFLWLLTAVVPARGGVTAQDDPRAPGAPAALVGSAFTYQGQLRLNGNAVDDSCDFQFSLWDAAVGGAQVGSTQTVGAVAVTGGLFTVQLDFGGGAFNGAARWLGTSVRCPAGAGGYTALSPRQPLTAAPHALALPGLWTETGGSSPNLIGGFEGNGVAGGVVGAVIGGGGQSGFSNQVTADFGVVGGGQGNVVTDTYGTVGGGADNSALAIYTTVAGGQFNTARDWNATVSGGYFNTADGLMATIGGGSSSDAIGDYATVAGGVANDALGFATTVAGGNDNDATASAAAVGGGQYNVASNFYAAIAGGANNSASGIYSAIGGGSANSVTADYATTGGGRDNVVSDLYGTIGGGRNNAASADDATVGGGVFNTASEGSATVGGGASNTATGWEATVSGGGSNYASGYAATISGGEQNTAFGALGTVGGGNLNHAYGDYSTIGGGNGSENHGYFGTIGGGTANYITDTYGTIGGGRWNRVEAPLGTIAGGGYHNPDDRNWVTDEGGFIGGGGSNLTGNGNGVTTDAYYGAIAGGWNNTASNKYTAIGGGHGNIADGEVATVPGGWNNAAIGNYSFAAGCGARALHAGSFVWADSRNCTNFDSQRDYQFRVRAYGGFTIDDEASNWIDMLWTHLINTSSGAFLSYGGTWTNASDAALKEQFAPVDSRDVLERVAALPLSSWSYKAEEDSTRHLGPTAQDFYAAFGLGESDTAISTVDADGVALAAIQGLHATTQEQAAEIAALREQNAAMEARLAALERAAGAAAPTPWLSWAPLAGLLLVAGFFLAQRRAGLRRAVASVGRSLRAPAS